MPRTFLPTRESELVTWSANFEQVVAADPAKSGLTVEQATAYTGAQAAFAVAYQTANDPLTRSPSNIEAKNTAKKALIALTRELVKIAQAYPAMTDARRVTLGITVPDPTPTPVPVPETSPTIDIVSVDGWSVSFRLHNGDATRRARPAGVKGATVFSYVGEQPPNAVDDWKFEGSISETSSRLDFPTTLTAGTKVWLTAFWFNTKMQSGPAAVPVSTQINYGGLSQAA